MSNAFDFRDLGRHLFTARTRRGWTQRQLAAQCGVDPTAIARMENGQRRPTLNHLTRLAYALRVSLQWFLTGSNRAKEDIPGLVVELHDLGVVDLIASQARVPGAFRPPEQVIALASTGDEPEPRLLEALPAVLAWNAWDPRLLCAYALSYEKRTLYRLAWLADIALTINRLYQFPGGCPARRQLSRFLKRVKPPREAEQGVPPRESDGLGRPATEGVLHPAWKRWGISYAGNLAAFRERAVRLQDLREDRPPEGTVTNRVAHE